MRVWRLVGVGQMPTQLPGFHKGASLSPLSFCDKVFSLLHFTVPSFIILCMMFDVMLIKERTTIFMLRFISLLTATIK